MGTMGRRRGRRTRSTRQRPDWSALLPPPRERRGPRWWRSLMDWLYRPVGQAPDPDALVELTRLPNRIQAEALARELHGRNIKAVLFGADAEGLAPHLAVGEGHRVMVRA